MRVNLNVPFDQKDEARRAGARWDMARKTWYVENVERLEPFMAWIDPRLLKPCSSPSKKGARR